MDRSLFAGGIAAAEAAAPASKSSGAMSGAASAAAIVSDAGIADGIAGAAGVGAAGSADGIAVLLAFRAAGGADAVAGLLDLQAVSLPCAAVISMRGLIGSAARLAGGSIPKKTSCLKTARVVVWVQRLSRWMPIANRAERPAGADSLCSQELSS